MSGTAEGSTPPDHGTTAELERLRAELVEAKAEIARLQEEIARLRPARAEASSRSAHRSQLAPTLFVPVEETPVGVDGNSPREDKISLFRSLFAGRTDVYAQRWENPSTKKSGWSPVALDGRWSQAERRYTPLDDSVIDSHLSGRIVAGVYPLIHGDRCCLLACDFDKGSWLLDALAFLEVCSEVGVPACLERSRSGNGAHVWIFFDGPVEAAVARRLGTGLLRETMAVRAEIDPDQLRPALPVAGLRAAEGIRQPHRLTFAGTLAQAGQCRLSRPRDS